MHMVRTDAIYLLRRVVEQTTTAEVKNLIDTTTVEETETKSKFPRQQLTSERFYKKMYRQKQQQVTIQRHRKFKNRDKLSLIADLLELALTYSYNGLINIGLKIYQMKLNTNHKQGKRVISDAIEMGLVRQATEQEMMDYARRMIIHTYNHGNMFNDYTATPPIQRVKQYMRTYLGRMYMLTEKGRKLGEILRSMKELIN